MCETTEVRWTVIPCHSPRPWLPCAGCGERSAFESSDKVRLNANGRRLDAWLIYRCMRCDTTWNRPIFERRSVGSIAPVLLAALQGNEAACVRALAFDLDALRHRTDRIDEAEDVELRREAIRMSEDARMLAIAIAAPLPTGIRLDRLLASELRASRKRIAALHADGRLRITADRSDPLRHRIRDGTRLLLDLSAETARDAWLSAATGAG